MSKAVPDAVLREYIFDEYSNDHTLGTHLPPIGEPFRLSPSHSAHPTLGVLDRLPPEVADMIVEKLDLDSLYNFRTTSRKAFEIVNSLYAHGILIKHGRDALRCARFVRVSHRITCSQLYETLCKRHCETCGDFGGYIYLITCRRVCFLCLAKGKAFLPLTRTEACRKFGLNSKSMDAAPHIITRGGKYTSIKRELKDGLAFFDYEACHEIGVNHHGSEEEMKKYVDNVQAREDEEYERTRSSQGPGEESSVRRPRNDVPGDAQSGDPRRFAAIVRAPWYNAPMGLVEWGFHCHGCGISRIRETHYRKKYDWDSYRRHIEEYGLLQRGEHEKSSRAAYRPLFTE